MATRVFQIKIGVDDTELTKLSNFAVKWGPKIGTALTGIGAAVTGALGLAVNAFGDAQNASLQLDAALKSTAGAAGLTRKELDDMATALSRATAFDDDAITQAQSVLLTFKSVAKDSFGGAMEAALDLSTRLGGDLQQAVIQVGKALEDPERGLTALRKSGVSFTEEQQALIKTLVETGDKAQAQSIILGELASQFGGAAKAEAAGFKGQLTQLNNEFGNIVETIGGALVPTLTGLLESIKPIVLGVSDWIKENPTLTTTIVGIAAAVGTLATALGPLLIALPSIISLIGGAGGLAGVLAAITGPIGLTVAAIAGLVAAGVALYKNSETVRDTVQSAWGSLSEFATEIWEQIRDIVTQTAAAILAVWNKHKDTLLPIITTAWKVIQGIFTTAFATLKATVTGGLKVLSGLIDIWTGILTGDFDKFTGGLAKIWEGLWKILAGMVQAAQTAIRFAVEAIWNVVKGLFQSGKDAVINFWKGLWSALTGVVTAAWNSLKGAVSAVTDGVTGFFKGMYDKVVGHSIVPDMMTRIGQEFGRLPGLMVGPTQTQTAAVTAEFESMSKDVGDVYMPTMISDIDAEMQKLPSVLVERARTATAETKGWFEDLVGFKANGIAGKFGESLDGLWEQFSSHGTDLFTESGNIKKRLVDTFTQAGKDMADKFIKNGLDAIKEKLLGPEGFDGLFRKVQGIVGNSLKNLGGIFQGFVGQIGGWFKDLFSSITSGIGALGGSLAGAGLLGAGLNVGGAAGTALSIGGGALSGFSIGNMILPGVGGAIGAGIGALVGGIASLFGKDQDKIDDTEIVEKGWPQIWALQGAYANAPVESPEAEVANRTSILGAGVEAWNVMAKAFKRPESKESQRPYIFDFIEAVNKTFSNRIAAFPAFDPGPMTLPVQPMARGGRGVVTEPTLFLAGEAGPERFEFDPIGRGQMPGGDTYNTTIHIHGATDVWETRKQVETVMTHLAQSFGAA